MGAAEEDVVPCSAWWFDNSWWEGQIGRAISTPDPVLANLRITVAHYRLSLAMRETLGAIIPICRSKKSPFRCRRIRWSARIAGSRQR